MWIKPWQASRADSRQRHATGSAFFGMLEFQPIPMECNHLAKPAGTKGTWDVGLNKYRRTKGHHSFLSPWPVQTVSLLFVLYFVSGAMPTARADMLWRGDQLQAEIGTVVASEPELVVRADELGRILVTIDADQLDLDGNEVVELRFSPLPTNAEVLLGWNSTDPEIGFVQRWFAASELSSIRLNMAAHPQWRGVATSLVVGARVPAQHPLTLRSLRVLPQSGLEELRQVLQAWGGFQPWEPASINRYKGSINADNGLAPAVFFAGVTGFSLLAYLVVLVATGRREKLSWSAAALITLACWIALDLFWQARLFWQAQQSYVTYAGKSAEEKLLASEDRQMVGFITRVKGRIEGEDARVILGSSIDYAGMLAAYYLAPVNTYWDRRGPVLPPTDYLASGDYVLLIAPFTANYRPGSDALESDTGDAVPVEELLLERTGILLRVL